MCSSGSSSVSVGYHISPSIDEMCVCVYSADIQRRRLWRRWCFGTYVSMACPPYSPSSRNDVVVRRSRTPVLSGRLAGTKSPEIRDSELCEQHEDLGTSQSFPSRVLLETFHLLEHQEKIPLLCYPYGCM